MVREIAKRRGRRKCPDCQEPVVVDNRPKIKLATTESESQKLWRLVLSGTENFIDLIEQYQEARMHGIPMDRIALLRERLDTVLLKGE
jgi:hypothetical protein